MATIKVACPKCGQKVSGDESFHGSVVECPICSSDIHFPGSHRHEPREEAVRAAESLPKGDSSPPASARDEVGKSAEKTRGEELPQKENRTSSDAPDRKQSSGESASEESATGSPSPNYGAISLAATSPNAKPEGPSSPIYGAISIVSAVLSVVTCIGGILFAPIAIIFGHTALAKARHSPVHPAPGQTLGAIGLMIGYVSLVITILVLFALVFFGDTIREGFQRVME